MAARTQSGTGYIKAGVAELLAELMQPVTVKQWSRMSGIEFEQARHIFSAARERGLIHCVTPEAARHRLYFFTVQGLKERRAAHPSGDFQQPELGLPQIDWKLYGSCCHSHRAAIIKTIGTESIRATTIRRLAVKRDSKLKMSQSNARDAIYWLVGQGILEPELIDRCPHPFYLLTDLGRTFQQLLNRADTWL